jgi:hypothetical protein
MISTAAAHRPHSVLASGLVAVLMILSLAGCGKDKTTNPTPNPAPSSTTYTGSVTGRATSGKLAVTLGSTTAPAQRVTSSASGTLTATGTLTPSGGAPVTLTGTYDDVAKTFSVSGGGWTFTGALVGTVLSGNFTGPGGVTGVFNLQQGTTGVTVVIGTFTSTSGGPNGTFNFSISGTAIGGDAVDTDGTVVPLNGTYTATSGAISIVHPANPTGAPLATGTFNATSGSASGAYNDQSGNSGNWTGARQ